MIGLRRYGSLKTLLFPFEGRPSPLLTVYEGTYNRVHVIVTWSRRICFLALCPCFCRCESVGHLHDMRDVLVDLHGRGRVYS